MSMRFSILTLGDNYEHLRSHDQFYREVVEEAQYAEDLGYEGFWIGRTSLSSQPKSFPFAADDSRGYLSAYEAASSGYRGKRAAG